MASNGDFEELGNLLVKFKGQYFFIPADKIGRPLVLVERQIAKIEANAADLKEHPEDEHNVEFAIRITEGELVTKIRRRN